MENNWISVRYREPYKEGKYLAFCDNPLYGIITCRFSLEYGGGLHWNPPSGKITHWQHLPQEPKIDSNGE